MDKYQFKLMFFSQKETNHLASLLIQDLISCHSPETASVKFKCVLLLHIKLHHPYL